VDATRAEALLAFAEESPMGLASVDTVTWQRRLGEQSAELANAFDWFLTHQRPTDALRLAVSLADHWMHSGDLADGTRRLERGLAVVGVEPRIRGRAHCQAGMLAFWEGRDERARSAFQAAREVARECEDGTTEALALAGLARIALRAKQTESARSLCEEALHVDAGSDDDAGRSSAIHVLSVAAQMSGDLNTARDLMLQRMEMARKRGNLSVVSYEASNLSAVERQLGHARRANELALEALDIEVRRSDKWAIPYTVNQLAALAVDSSDFARAATLLGAAERMVEDQGAEWPPDELPVFQASRDAAAAALAAADVERAWSRGAAMSVDELVRLASD
jgi:tetratricopeptide (TPR) repeat protein